MTKTNQEQNQVSEEVQERMNEFNEGFTKLVEETGITIQATLNYTKQGIQPVVSMQDLEALREANEEPQDDPESTDADESDDIVMAEGEE